MADDANNAQAHQQLPQPSSDLTNLGERLVGKWEMSGEVGGRVTFEWMEGGFFLIQHVDLEQYGQRIKGIEIIGHERLFGSEPGEEIKSRFYSNTGDTLDYVYELEGNTLTIWAGEKGSPAYAKGTFGEDGNTGLGEWEMSGWWRVSVHHDQGRVTKRPNARAAARPELASPPIHQLRSGSVPGSHPKNRPVSN